MLLKLRGAILQESGTPWAQKCIEVVCMLSSYRPDRPVSARMCMNFVRTILGLLDDPPQLDFRKLETINNVLETEFEEVKTTVAESSRMYT